jgi:polysaccharide biosynthesis/export protein
VKVPAQLLTSLPVSVFLAALVVTASPLTAEDNQPGPGVYHLGPGDVISVTQANAEELDDKTARIDDQGWANLPLAGRVQLGGATVEEAESRIGQALSKLLVSPRPVVSIVEYKSQPVSVIGAVNTPGVLQLQGNKTLLEVLSMAGGLRADAAAQVQVTRHLEYGRLPLPGEALDAQGKFSTGRIDIAALIKGNHPENNIAVFPHDVISVPRADLIYVTGDVKKAGGFPLESRQDISVLQALSLAEGLGPRASPKKAVIFRAHEGSTEKEEIPVDISAILSGTKKDMPLVASDILFIPDSLPKKAGYRAAEAALQAVTGIAIWGRF